MPQDFQNDQHLILQDLSNKHRGFFSLKKAPYISPEHQYKIVWKKLEYWKEEQKLE